MSEDPSMIQAYNEGKDLYCVIAEKMFNNKYEDNLEFYPEGTELELDGKKIICGNKTHLNKAGKERRSAAKTMLLAILYGMSAATAGARMGKSKEEGQELMDSFFIAFPKVKELIAESKNFLLKNGYVEDWAGRRRRLPDIKYRVLNKPVTATRQVGNFNPLLDCEDILIVTEDNDPKCAYWVQMYLDKDASKLKPPAPENIGWEVSNEAFNQVAQQALADGVILTAHTGQYHQAERQCLNARIQGGAASLTKLAMVNISNNKELKDMDAKLIITVHDEVLVECPAFYADRVEKLLPQIMIDTAKPYITTVPMKCDPYNVSRWYADEAAVAVQSEFKKFEAKGKTREEALELLYETHPELPKQAILDVITGNADELNF